jgi:hypothetical protein
MSRDDALWSKLYNAINQYFSDRLAKLPPVEQYDWWGRIKVIPAGGEKPAERFRSR